MVQFGGTGFKQGDKILIVGATNRPQELDEAVKRRLEKRLYIPLPDKEARKVFITNLIEKEIKEGIMIDMSEADIDEIVDLTQGYSGADLKSLSTEASFVPIRSVDDISTIAADQIRNIQVDDFK